MGLSPQPGNTVGRAPPALKGWLQKKELKLAVALRGPGQGLEAPSLPGPNGGARSRGDTWEMEPSWGQVMSEALEGAPPGSGGQVVGRLKERAKPWALWAPELVFRLARCRGAGGWNCHPGWSSCGWGSLCPIGRGLARAQGSAVVGSLCGSQ